MKKLVAMVALATACTPGGDDVSSGDEETRDDRTGYEAPVATNAESPVAYPPDLFDQGVEGRVILRLFVDETGSIHSDSAIVVESSGNLQLDSAALLGVAEMQFAPARQDGVPVAGTFLQPVDFRNPEAASGNETP